MDTSINALGQSSAANSALLQAPRLMPRDMRVNSETDKVDLGKTALTSAQSMNIVMERALDKLRGVVGDARAALGLPEGAQLDTSPEATGNRIADFAIGAFSKWQKQHADLPEEEARQQFASFIGGAVQQGISEARGILSALNALNPSIDQNINTTWDVVSQRLNDFVNGK